MQDYFRYNIVNLTVKEHIYYKGSSRPEDNLVIDLSELVKCCPKLRKLRNDIVPINWSLDAVKSIASLEVLEIDWRKKRYRFSGLDQLLSKCVNLKELGLIGYEAVDGFQFIPNNLVRLCLDYCIIPYQDLKNILTINGKTLRQFEYHNPTDNGNDDKISSNLIDIIGENCRELVTLRLYINCNSINALKKLNNLHNLFLIMNISGKDVEGLMRNNQQLRWMIVHQKEINYTEALTFCIRYSPEMKQMSINNDRIPVFSEYEIKLWKNLPNLKLIHGRPLQYYENNLVTFASD